MCSKKFRISKHSMLVLRKNPSSFLRSGLQQHRAEIDPIPLDLVQPLQNSIAIYQFKPCDLAVKSLFTSKINPSLRQDNLSLRSNLWACQHLRSSFIYQRSLPVCDFIPSIVNCATRFKCRLDTPGFVLKKIVLLDSTSRTSLPLTQSYRASPNNQKNLPIAQFGAELCIYLGAFEYQKPSKF